MRVKGSVYLYKERGRLDSNTYVINDGLTLLIDPGLEDYLEQKLKEMRDDGIYPRDIDVIAITHLHPDHCNGTAALAEVSGAKVALHPVQVDYLEIMAEESRRFLGVDIGKKFSADLLLDGRLSLGSRELDVLHTPGHSPCSICFYAEDTKILICGDLLFEQGVGRTDLPFGNTEALRDSIETVSALDTELLLPGHGRIIEGGSNVKRNYGFVKAVYFKPFF
ncbi:MAG: MBL fold metallo-hydrolase [Candidatus Methanospirareceae archaeon]